MSHPASNGGVSSGGGGGGADDAAPLRSPPGWTANVLYAELAFLAVVLTLTAITWTLSKNHVRRLFSRSSALRGWPDPASQAEPTAHVDGSTPPVDDAKARPAGELDAAGSAAELARASDSGSTGGAVRRRPHAATQHAREDAASERLKSA